MKTKLFIIVIGILYVTHMWAAMANPLNFATFHTGTNPAATAPGVVGTNDFRWVVSYNNSPYVSAVIINPCSVCNNATSGITNNWISYNFNCPSLPVNNYSCNGPTVDLYYKITFNLTVAQTQTFAVNWAICANSWVQEVLVNGPQRWATTQAHPNNQMNWVPFNYCGPWNIGYNEIVIHTISIQTISSLAGLLVTASPPAPLAISGNTLVCAGSTNTYITNTIAGSSGYNWVLPGGGWNGSSSNATINTTAGNSSGLITVYAIAPNLTGVSSPSLCYAVAQLSVTVNPTPAVNVTASPSLICPGASATLTATGASTYSWLPVPNTLPSGAAGSQIVVTPVVPGTFTVIGTDLNGCTTKTTVGVGWKPLPTLFITPTPGYFACTGISQTLTASGGVTYTWNANPAIPNPWVTMLSPPQTVTVWGTGSNGCINSTSLTFTAGALIPVSASDATLCTDVGPCVNISASTTFTGWPPIYTWAGPNINGPITAQTITVCPTVSAIYTVTANSPVLCPNAATMAVTVQTCCPPPDPAITFSIPNVPLCNLTLTNLAQYAYSVAAGGLQTPMTGTFNGTGVTSNGTSYDFNLGQSLTFGTYSIAFTYTTAPWGCSYTLYQTVTILPPLTVYALPAYRCAYSSSPVTIFGDVLPNQPPPYYPWAYPITYSWSPGGMTGTSPSVSPTVNTVYTITAMSAGCIGSATLMVTMVNTCCPQSASVPVLGTPSLTAGSLTSSLTGPIIIDQDLTISGPGNYTLQTGDFLMNMGVKIILQPGVNLVLSDAHLYACQYSWQGIIVQNGANVVSAPGPLGLSTLIEDAYTGIDVSNIGTGCANPLLDLNGVIFNKNYLAISIANSSLTSIPFNIRSCVFTSRQLPFSTPFSNPPSWPSTSTTGSGLRFALPNAIATSLSPPFALSNYPLVLNNVGYLNWGIRIQDIGNIAGASPSTGAYLTPLSVSPNEFNLFDYLQVGIDVIDASLKTVNNTFQNMGACGISHRATGTMNMRLSLSAAPNNNNRFWINNWGQSAYWSASSSVPPTGIIACNLLEFDIYNAQFRGSFTPNNTLGSGIFISTNRFDNYVINRNTFSNLSSGLDMRITPGSYNIGSSWYGVYAGSMLIPSNFFGPQINTTTPAGSNIMGQAIHIDGYATWNQSWQIPSLSGCSLTSTLQANYIYLNTIDRAGSGIGISGMKCYPLGITNNTMTIKGFDGIDIRYTLGNKTIRENVITAITNNPLYGVYCQDNYSLAITCNTVSNTYNGFFFYGSNPCTWTGNIMTNNAIGLHLGGWNPPYYPSYIGTQGGPNNPSGNRWLGTWGSNGSYETMIDDPTITFGNEIYYDVSDPNSLPLNNGSNSGMYFYTTTYNSLSPFISLKPAIGDYFCPSVTSFRSAQESIIEVQEQHGNVQDDIHIYPNPTTGKVTIQGESESETLLITVTDMTGKTIYSKAALTSNYNCNIDLSFAEGIYLIKIKDQNNKLVHKKLIISK